MLKGCVFDIIIFLVENSVNKLMIRINEVADSLLDRG